MRWPRPDDRPSLPDRSWNHHDGSLPGQHRSGSWQYDEVNAHVEQSARAGRRRPASPSFPSDPLRTNVGSTRLQSFVRVDSESIESEEQRHLADSSCLSGGFSAGVAAGSGDSAESVALAYRADRNADGRPRKRPVLFGCSCSRSIMLARPSFSFDRLTQRASGSGKQIHSTAQGGIAGGTHWRPASTPDASTTSH